MSNSSYRVAMSCAEFAAAVGVSRHTVWRWIRSRRIAATRLGKSYFIPAAVVDSLRNGSPTTVPSTHEGRPS